MQLERTYATGKRRKNQLVSEKEEKEKVGSRIRRRLSANSKLTGILCPNPFGNVKLVFPIGSFQILLKQSTNTLEYS